MILHKESSLLAGKTVRLKNTVKHFQFPNIGGSEYHVEDWQDRVMKMSWMDNDGNPACMVYALRIADNNLPFDNEVLYGKVGLFGHLIHISEIEIP